LKGGKSRAHCFFKQEAIDQNQPKLILPDGLLKLLAIKIACNERAKSLPAHHKQIYKIYKPR